MNQKKFVTRSLVVLFLSVGWVTGSAPAQAALSSIPFNAGNCSGTHITGYNDTLAVYQSGVSSSDLDCSGAAAGFNGTFTVYDGTNPYTPVATRANFAGAHNAALCHAASGTCIPHTVYYV